MKWIGTSNLGMLFLSIFLILYGLAYFVTLPINMMAVLAVLAIVAGVLLLIGK
jgi:hypothetical protein